MGGIYLRKIEKITVRRDGPNVILIMENRRPLDMPWDAALSLAKAITRQARLAEEQAKAPAIALDQALLMRSGAPFGLTNNPDIIAEAKKEAVGNTKLRRYLTGNRAKGIGGPTVGAPTVIQHPPKP